MKTNNQMVRVRFAPSPTGPLHIGGLRTALFNYLFARKNNGKFILRIEDTDRQRYVPGAEEYIIESLRWVGLDYDEGPDVGGEFGPYRQSERIDIYKKYAQQLVDSGWAYYAFDTPEELEQMRQRLREQKSPVQLYNHLTRGEMKNSFTLPEEEVKRRIEAGEPYVIRFNMPAGREIVVNDIIRGEVRVNSDTLDDKILFKSDGFPTYHLANIVDDHLMQISHVIRGEEWLPSLPLHVLLYEAFGWEPPQFAHLPLILKPSGKGKLSKRDGDQLGFPVFPLDWKDPQTGEVIRGYREWGYLPEAVINILVLLGWNPGTDQEIFTLDELIEQFSLDRVQKHGARFDPEKARWFNQQHLKRKSDEELARMFMPILQSQGIEADFDYVKQVVRLLKERVEFVEEFWTKGYYFFERPKEFDPKAAKKAWKQQTPEIMRKLRDFLAGLEDFSSANLEEQLKKWVEQQELSFSKVFTPLRLVIQGSTAGPHLFDMMELLGKDEILARIDYAIEHFESKA